MNSSPFLLHLSPFRLGFRLLIAEEAKEAEGGEGEEGGGGEERASVESNVVAALYSY